MDTHFVKKAILEFNTGDIKTGMLIIAPVIDDTAHRRYPEKGVGDRIRAFLNDEINNLFHLISTRNGGARLIFTGGAGNGTGGTMVFNGMSIEDILYKFIRRSLIHDAEWPKEVTLLDDSIFRPGALPKLWITFLPHIVIGAKENKSYKFDETLLIMNSKKDTKDINIFWGKIDEMIAFLKE